MFDMHTAISILGVVQLACALALILVWLWNPSIPGVKEWAIGRGLMFLAFIVLVIRGLLPLPLSVVAGNGVLLLGWYYLWLGVIRFIKIDPKQLHPYILSFSLLFLVLMYYWSAVDVQFANRVVLSSCSIIFFSALLVWAIRSSAMREQLLSLRLLQVIFNGFILLHLFRAGYYLAGLGGYNLMNAGQITGVTTTLEIFLTILVGMACLGLVIESMTARLTQLAERDMLTDAYNRRAFFTIVDNLFARGKRDHVPMAVCYIDLDNFKAINDEFGHHAGDEVLKRFATMAQHTLRKHDLFARFGGEEFVVVLPDTSLSNARAIAERLRESFIALELPDMPQGYVTCSIGVAAVDSLTEDICINDLLEQSDHALYHAKRSGKNMVCSY